MLRTKPKTSHMLGMGSYAELYPEACFYFETLSVAWFSPEHPLYSSDRLCELTVLPYVSPGPPANVLFSTDTCCLTEVTDKHSISPPTPACEMQSVTMRMEVTRRGLKMSCLHRRREFCNNRLPSHQGLLKTYTTLLTK